MKIRWHNGAVRLEAETAAEMKALCILFPTSEADVSTLEDNIYHDGSVDGGDTTN